MTASSRRVYQIPGWPRLLTLQQALAFRGIKNPLWLVEHTEDGVIYVYAGEMT